MSNQINILGIPFTDLKQNEVLDYILNNIEHKKLFFSTPNPEILLESGRNPFLKKTLQNTSLNIPDGTGIIWANEFLNNSEKFHNSLMIIAIGILELLFLPFKLNKKTRFRHRITGTDLMINICKNIKFNKYKIFLLGGINGVAQKTRQILEKANPGIQIVGTSEGNPTDHNHSKIINESGADILFVAYGCPKQEFWIAENFKHLKSVNFAMGIGGAFDFISKNIIRAPNIFQRLGIEWLFRLFQQPLIRSKRIYQAVIVFPYTVIKNRLKSR